MTFRSILFENPEDRTEENAPEAPNFFTDLNCDQIVDGHHGGKEEYNLKPFFYACLRRLDAIIYRHEVMQDLENALAAGTGQLFRAKNARNACNISSAFKSCITRNRSRPGSWMQLSFIATPSKSLRRISPVQI